MSASAKRVVSGIKPTGNLHLGNYLGAVKQWVAMQNQVQADGGETLFFIADLHAPTEWIAPADLRAQTIEMTATLVAAGIDPNRSILFNQTRVPQHSELTWLLNTVARVGWLNRMTQFKDKAGKNREGASVGLYDYPVLMAADVLLYNATHVPVGEDQKQHLELARDIATKFNNDYATDLFALPEPLISAAAPRIMSLRDASTKMSKSNPSEQSVVKLVDSDDTIAEKFRKAKSDADLLPATVAELADRPEARNLLTIFAALADRAPQDVLGDYAGKGFGAFKPALADLAVAALAPIRDEMVRLLDDKAAIDSILNQGAEKARALAAPTLKAAQDAMGLLA
ncbi:tryptophan--tRNA ligase [Sphingomonas oligophenolica]|uniref:Tryptophan--tRNA ligase n=1 Tax=Sphingomonas oligophenolica TaxID=301154 RepID=A0A502CJC3_9SPHN|nr:tryptophan--tRNA ligase [Sphingomonas oligophenolica]TPG12744.1 tryptophan--tRNA ligase [Sphingomonas oligophenolica]